MSAVIHPFDESGIERGADGIARYQNRPRSLVEMLRNSVDKSPNAEALVEVGGERLTYRELWDRSARTAGGLRALGVQPGDRVAIRLGNSSDWCVAFWGIQMAGAIAVPVNTRFTDAEVEYVINDSGSKHVFEPNRLLPQGESLVVENAEQNDVAAIFYTSGTTGFPKGAMTTHDGFLSNIETCRRVSLLPFDGSMRTLVSVPLFHVTGCNSQFLVALEGGSATVIMPAFNVQSFLKLIGAERINTLTSVPAVYWLALNQPNFREVNTSAISRVSYGGAPIAPDLVGRIIEAFPNARVGNGFGLTECSSVATFLPHEYARSRPETVGFAAPVVDLKLEGVLPGSDVGELLMRGPNVVKGYWNKPEATAETFAGGWLRTGDMARLDEQGFVQIVDRKKDMVNRGGENVYCVEVENALSAHPAVFEVAVVGVPDKMMGEKVGAAVVLKPGATANAADIVSFAKEHLADFKVPQYLVLRGDTLPRNPGGKILKKQLRENLEWGKQLW
ncbi:MAG TPA: AMP-binding protein [Candidatus Angelobacter sp.]|nr:AMP-binding protein [Candidatus Angelobacter sp.]